VRWPVIVSEAANLSFPFFLSPRGALRVPQFDDDHFKESVRDATDIVSLIAESVTLQPQRGGREYVGLCPFHDDHNPSMRVYPDRKSFKCWSCNEGGDCFSFVMKRERISFPEALEMLARRAHLEMPRRHRSHSEQSGQNKNRLYEIVAWAENEFHECLLKAPAGERARRYLQDRRISAASMSRFRLGYHPDNWQWLIERARGRYTPAQLVEVGLAGERDGHNGFYDNFVDRVVFPIRDAQKRPVAFGGRVLPGGSETAGPKYWNGPDTVLFHKSRLLYALDHARDSISKSKVAVVTEGYTDCILAHQYGLTNFVATLGTALNESHVMNIKRLAQRVVLVFDGDDPGKLATEKALPKFLAHEIDLRILTLPDNLDPADFLIERGPEPLLALLDRAPEAFDVKLRLTRERNGLDSIDSRHRVLTEMLDLLAQVPAAVGAGPAAAWQMRENVILGRLSHDLKISETVIRERLDDLRTAQQQRAGTASAAKVSNDDADSQQAQIRSLPQIPTRDDLAERELLQIIFTIPEKVERIRKEIAPAELTNASLRELLEICFQMQDQGVLPSYDGVTARLEDASLKNLASDIDLAARDRGISAELVEPTLGYFRKRREIRRKTVGPPGGPHVPESGGGPDQSARERLRQATELHRLRVSRTTLK
jgi:DNA primase